MFSPCGVNGGNPRGCLAGKDLRPKGSRLDVKSLQVSIPSFDTDFDEPKMNQTEIGEILRYFLPGVPLTLTTERGVMGKSRRNTTFLTLPPPGQMYLYLK